MKWHFASELSPLLSAWQRLSLRQPCLQTCAWRTTPHLYNSLNQPMTSDYPYAQAVPCKPTQSEEGPTLFRVMWQSITRRGLITDTTELLSTSLLPQALSSHRSQLFPAPLASTSLRSRISSSTNCSSTRARRADAPTLKHQCPSTLWRRRPYPPLTASTLNRRRPTAEPTTPQR